MGMDGIRVWWMWVQGRNDFRTRKPKVRNIDGRNRIHKSFVGPFLGISLWFFLYFLRPMLQKINFHSKWVSKILNSGTSLTGSILTSWDFTRITLATARHVPVRRYLDFLHLRGMLLEHWAGPNHSDFGKQSNSSFDIFWPHSSDHCKSPYQG